MANDKQKTYWTEVAGPKWLRLSGAMEARLEPVSELVIERARLQPGERVLDVGCGTGLTSLAAARAVGLNGDVLGVDIAAPMIEAARAMAERERAVNLRFTLGDAQTETFPPPAQALISRFGVMFFEDPVAAFTNLRRNAAPGGRLIFAAWGPVSANPHWQKPLELAEALLGPGQPRRPHAPGPQAFDDPDYVRAILRDSGWHDYEVEVVPVFLRGASLDDEARVACFMGPSGALLDEKNATPAQREALCAAIRAALPDYTRMTPEGRVLLPGTIHLLTARNT
ncbi:class I SAM-dependent methyltransferase [Acidocella sp.]|uniref:class I SAM-dependent methyltransferase n=1 Tax=Acidocella sp. TaxID=50710 RepID=UPI00263379D8|nr:class I SAM-dependent methyltransferase [Acidocella sp.]